MKASLKHRVSVKLFAGYLITSEVKRGLFESDTWKLALIAWQSQENGVKIIPYQSKEYVGMYLEDQILTLSEIREHEKEIKKHLAKHCPKLDDSHLKLFVFPQIFIS